MSYIENITKSINRNDNAKDKGIGTIKIKENGSYQVVGFDNAEIRVSETGEIKLLDQDGDECEFTSEVKDGIISITPVYEYPYETNEVNSMDDLIEGRIYHLNPQNLFKDYAVAVTIDYSLEKELSGYCYNLVVDFKSAAPNCYSDDFEVESYDSNWINLKADDFFCYIAIDAPNQFFNHIGLEVELVDNQVYYFKGCDMMMDPYLKAWLQEYINGFDSSHTFEQLNFFSKSDYLGEGKLKKK